jgi:hypothetical protein
VLYVVVGLYCATSNGSAKRGERALNSYQRQDCRRGEMV